MKFLVFGVSAHRFLGNSVAEWRSGLSQSGVIIVKASQGNCYRTTTDHNLCWCLGRTNRCPSVPEKIALFLIRVTTDDFNKTFIHCSAKLFSSLSYENFALFTKPKISSF